MGWACLLIRAMLLSNHIEDARRSFITAFPMSLRVQQLAWRQPVTVPAAWLADVAEHLEASKALLRVLMNFREMPANDLCDTIEDVLLARFLPLQHAAPVVLASEMVNDIVG